ncbi:Integrin alpha-PS3 [Eumeta japonica]|uniref:Integrin alpha-PS3 n=1 Tax=Eumeta variegata TaxID=151549 RepID=A0A4C2A8U7_EUMVA|nr:Integrin alpha-PS3 [Eumeta japonica]
MCQFCTCGELGVRGGKPCYRSRTQSTSSPCTEISFPPLAMRLFRTNVSNLWPAGRIRVAIGYYVKTGCAVVKTKRGTVADNRAGSANVSPPNRLSKHTIRAGGVVEYRLSDRAWAEHHRARSITVPTADLKKISEEYFGYSVESGVFEPGGETLYVAGAPRGAAGRGRVLIFKPSDKEMLLPNIKSSLEGTQLGTYFGASLLCVDLNADGRADVLVGAPNYVSQHDKFSYDQGAVYVYLTDSKESDLKLNAAGSVRGSGASGARFGSALAALGDVDGDGHPEVAVGAPWEESGRGAVYVYSAHAQSLRTTHAQRISPSGARGFGIAISKGLDIDGNGCNDLAVGAYASDETYLFRCVPTITIKVSIDAPRALEYTKNITKFTALFSVDVDSTTAWPNVKLDLSATISVDKGEGRAYLIEDSKYKIAATPKLNSCERRTVVIKENSDLSRPINLAVDVIPQRGKSSLYSSNKVRLSNSSVTHSSSNIQLTGDCGEDLICQPEIIVQLKDLESSLYIPGSGDRVGAVATVINAGEPAYGAVVNFSLPAAPKKVPSSCEMLASNMTCKVPSPE